MTHFLIETHYILLQHVNIKKTILFILALISQNVYANEIYNDADGDGLSETLENFIGGDPAVADQTEGFSGNDFAHKEWPNGSGGPFNIQFFE